MWWHLYVVGSMRPSAAGPSTCMLGQNKFGGLRLYVHRFKFSLIQKGCDKTFPPASILDFSTTLPKSIFHLTYKYVRRLFVWNVNSFKL